MAAEREIDRGAELNERLSFIGLEQDHSESLAQHQPIIKEALPAVMDEFYAHLAKWPDLEAKFGSAEVKKHARDGQMRHWENISRGQFDERYMESSLTIGQTHNRIGLEPRWYIGGYALLTSRLMTSIVESYVQKPFALKKNKDELYLIIDAMVRAVFLDMDLAVSTYMEAKDDDYTKLLEKMTDEFDKNMAGFLKDLTVSSQELTETASSLTGLAKSGLEQSQSMAASTEEASSSVDTVAAAAEQLSASIQEINTQLNRSASIAREAAEKSQEASDAINVLKESAKKIDDVINLINDIAEQTNLLALNATIEAARAGDAGKGFAVVAGEVKELSTQTGKATSEISELIKNIQTSVNDTARTINEVSKTIQDMEEISTAVSSSVEEQSSATQEIVRSAQNASEGSNELASVAAGVSDNASKTDKEAKTVTNAASDMSEKTGMLKDQLDVFLSNIKTQ